MATCITPKLTHSQSLIERYAASSKHIDIYLHITRTTNYIKAFHPIITLARLFTYRGLLEPDTIYTSYKCNSAKLGTEIVPSGDHYLGCLLRVCPVQIMNESLINTPLNEYSLANVVSPGTIGLILHMKNVKFHNLLHSREPKTLKECV